MTMKPKTLPLRLNTAILAPFFLPGEPAVVVKMVGVGNTAPFEMRGGGTTGRSFILEWNSRLDGHVVRIPLSLWMAQDARMAHELMDHRRMSHAMVVTFEMPAPVGPAVAEVGTTVVPGHENDGAASATCNSHPGNDSDPAPTSTSTSTSIFISRPAKTGAAESNVDASIVVGRGNVPSPAAPTLAGTEPGAGSPAPAPASAPTNETVTPGEVAVTMIGGRPLHEVAHERLLKPQRVKALAALLKVNEATLREAVAAAGSRIEIAGPWMRRRAGNDEG